MRAASLVVAAFVLSAVGCGRSPAYPREAPPGVEGPAIGEASDADPNEERLTLRAGRWTYRDVRLEGDRLWGPFHELQHFDDGFRGNSPNGFLFLSEHEDGYVSGIIGSGKLTNVTYSMEENGRRLISHGRWAASAFGLEVAKDMIVVNRRFCSDVYRRVPNTDVFHGKPDCWQAGIFGADIHVPAAFFKRPLDEQVVFLSAFLS